MKRIAILTIMIGILAGLAYGQDLSIETINIVPPGNTCKYEWQATIKNNDPSAVTGIIAVQGRQGQGGNWHPAAGASVTNLNPGQIKTATAKWTRKPGVTEFKIEIYYAGGIVTEEIMPLPVEPPTDVQIISADFRDNGYTINIRNNAPHPASEIIKQASMASPQNPNTWVPIGGDTIPCIPAGTIEQKNYVRSPGWKDGYTKFKVALYRAGANVGERIFDYTPSPSARETEIVPLKPKPPQPFLRRIWPRKR
ncbi:MAG: hypothetical protein JSW17_00395 [Candidatus Omnitrophota bacterium]|nr:MAG: hypothetical protein JSW17_00395 [Candidatus Omnitrophota bacterium]